MKIDIKQLKVPKLRFPGFKGEWEEKRLGEVGKFLRGGGISKEEISGFGKYPCIRYGELYTEYDEVINIVKSRTNISPDLSLFSAENDLLIPSSGETALDIASVSCLKDGQVLIGGDVNVIRLIRDQCGIFFAYYLSNIKNKDISKLSQGHSVVHLYSSHLKSLKVNIPIVEEQQKIAEFLESVDKMTENLKTQKEFLESYKKGIMQKIFSQEIRFKDENGKEFPKWEEKRLGDCLDYEQPTNYIVRDTEYDDGYKIPVLTAGKTFILGYTNETDNIFGVDNLPVIIFDDFTTTSQFVTFPFKVKSSAMKILFAKNDVDIRFIFEAMQQIKYEIGGHGRHWISKFANIKISIPSSQEQNKISDFLTSLDKVIESKGQQITQAEQWKRGLMQELFV